jgi:hypothetical protein
MGDVEHYREQAEFSLHMAATVSNLDDKARWLRLAAQWREMAQQAEKRSQAPVS